MPRHISYHICDFLVSMDGQITLLEFGNAFYFSIFDGRDIHNKKNIKLDILNHVKQKAFLCQRFPSLRNETHLNAIRRFCDEDEPAFDGGNSYLKERMDFACANEGKHDYHMELIQELNAKNTYLNSNHLVFDGTVDMMFVTDKNKRLLHTFLTLNNLAKYQPRTWYYDCQSTEPFKVPENITYFVIKESAGSLAEGTFLCSAAEVSSILARIKSKYLNFGKHEPEQLRYHNAAEQQVIIQELCTTGRKIDGVRATARAVFAVIENDSNIQIEMIDMFWQLAMAAETSHKPVYDEFISAKSYQQPSNNCWPSMNAKDFESISKSLIPILIEISTTAYQKMDIRNYLFALHQAKRFDDLKYYLTFYRHIRIDRLDEALCQLLLSLDKEFLIEQAKRFALPFYSVFPQMVLRKWLIQNIELFDDSPILLTNLKDFLHQQLTDIEFVKSLDALKCKEKYDLFVAFTQSFIKKIDEILSKGLPKANKPSTATAASVVVTTTATATASAMGTATAVNSGKNDKTSAEGELLKLLTELEAIELKFLKEENQKEALKAAEQALTPAAVTTVTTSTVASATVTPLSSTVAASTTAATNTSTTSPSITNPIVSTTVANKSSSINH